MKLGVNIDHVATLRQARRAGYPDLVAAAAAAERGGAEGITIHLREDRRHIQDDDVFKLRESIATKLNLEMAAIAEMVAIAQRAKPEDVCLVPERRQELTTEGGLDAAGQIDALRRVVEPLNAAGITVSLFIDADIHQVDAAIELGAGAIEIHTGKYAECVPGQERAAELARIRRACEAGRAAGLIVNAGHGLTLDNVVPIAMIDEINELNIGHSIVADAIFVGLEEAVRRMRARMQGAQ